MSTPLKWIVCEHSGRWAAALRIELARLPRDHAAPRLYEVRSLTELAAYALEHRHTLGLVEVRRANLAEVLDLLADSRRQRPGRFVALLDRSCCPRDPAVPITRSSLVQPFIDVLREAGAADVVESPRDLVRIMALGEKLAAVVNRSHSDSAEFQFVADRAWSMLPWQDP